MLDIKDCLATAAGEYKIEDNNILTVQSPYQKKVFLCTQDDAVISCISVVKSSKQSKLRKAKKNIWCSPSINFELPERSLDAKDV